MSNSRKLLAYTIIIFIVGVNIPVMGDIGATNYRDDTTPPVTTCTLNPPEPDGLNDWYVSDVEVTLNATDDASGVNVTYYRVNNQGWEIYEYPFVFNNSNYYTIEYYSIDNAGNEEEVKSAEIKLDQTKPEIELMWEAYQKDGRWYVRFTAYCVDAASGMNRVEFYKYGILKEVITGLGPIYCWDMPWNKYPVRGIICNPEITEEYVKFYAIIVIIRTTDLRSYPFVVKAVAYDNAGNSDYEEIKYYPPNPVVINSGIYMFRQVTLPNIYEGYIGRFFICATFSSQ